MHSADEHNHGTHTENSVYHVCESSGKTRYTQLDANRALAALRRAGNAGHRNRKHSAAKRAYRCRDCGGYHLSHLDLPTARLKKPKVDRRNAHAKFDQAMARRGLVSQPPKVPPVHARGAKR